MMLSREPRCRMTASDGMFSTAVKLTCDRGHVHCARGQSDCCPVGCSLLYVPLMYRW